MASLDILQIPRLRPQALQDRRGLSQPVCRAYFFPIRFPDLSFQVRFFCKAMKFFLEASFSSICLRMMWLEKSMIMVNALHIPSMLKGKSMSTAPVGQSCLQAPQCQHSSGYRTSGTFLTM
jgi:hypothetical protein